MATSAPLAMSRMVVWSKPRSRKRSRAAARIRLRVDSALGVMRVGLTVGSIAARCVDLTKLGAELCVAQRSQPARNALTVCRDDLESLAREGQQRRPRQAARQRAVALQCV